MSRPAESNASAQYYHRNMATEVMGIVRGRYGGSSRDLRAGGLSYQSSYMPHGGTGPPFRRLTCPGGSRRIGADSLE